MAEKEVEVPVTLNSQPMNKKLQEAKDEFNKLKSDLVQGFTSIATAAGAAGTAASAAIGAARAGWSAGVGAGVGAADRYMFEDMDASRVGRERALAELGRYGAGGPEFVKQNTEEIKKLSEILEKRYTEEEKGRRAVGDVVYPVAERVADAIAEALRASLREKVLESLGTTGR